MTGQEMIEYCRPVHRFPSRVLVAPPLGRWPVLYTETTGTLLCRISALTAAIELSSLLYVKSAYKTTLEAYKTALAIHKL